MSLKLNKSSFFNQTKVIFFKQCHDLSTVEVKKPPTKAQITENIAKKFNKVSLQKFPLIRTEEFSLNKFRKINKINSECLAECLDDKPVYYPSITSILNKTMPPESVAILKRWEAAKIKELGFDGFQKYRKNVFSRGKTLHQNVENYLKSRDTSVLQFPNKTQENIWKSIEHVMPEIDKLYGTEFPVHHPILKFQGIIDCVASYNQVPALFEWKSSEKLKPTLADTYDNPLQAVAYFSCLQFNDAFNNLKEGIADRLELPDIKEVILVIGYEDGSPAHVHIIEHSQREKIWKLFLKRLESFWNLTVEIKSE